MTRGDRLLIALLAIAALLAWPLAAAAASGSGGSVVVTGPRGETTIPLSDDTVLEVQGALGDVIVRVRDGQVSVAESGCPDQTCVRTGEVHSAGAVVACVPNRVIVRVGGDEADDLDVRVR